MVLQFLMRSNIALPESIGYNNNNKLFIRTYQYGLIGHISYKSYLQLIMSNATIQERK